MTFDNFNNAPRRTARRPAAIGLTACAIAVLGLTACEEGEREEAAQETRAALSEAGDKIASATSDAAEKTKAAAKDVYADITASADTVTQAVAVMQPTAGNETTGTVTFTQDGDAVRVDAQFANLPGGQHAYHVHLYGDCSSPDGKSAGTHFNFEGSTLNLSDDAKMRITGNLGDVTAGADGTATATATLETAELNGPLNILGRSVIIHAKGNDPSDPPIGAAGGRLACGVIGATMAEEG